MLPGVGAAEVVDRRRSAHVLRARWAVPGPARRGAGAGVDSAEGVIHRLPS
ncbi:hypothetical protein F750_1840 [Streptomyces sp. PAMC 26508]|nr:hypothetical protein F750_1840 [Streptomyces sp. PAMC 26508]